MAGRPLPLLPAAQGGGARRPGPRHRDLVLHPLRRLRGHPARSPVGERRAQEQPVPAARRGGRAGDTRGADQAATVHLPGSTRPHPAAGDWCRPPSRPGSSNGCGPGSSNWSTSCWTRPSARGDLEIVADLAYPLPVVIISELLGRAGRRPDEIPGLVQGTGRVARPRAHRPARRAGPAGRRSWGSSATYFRELIAARRRQPADDLLSALVTVEDQGDSLSEDELLATLILLLVAGHETTVNLIGNGVLALLSHPRAAGPAPGRARTSSGPRSRRCCAGTRPFSSTAGSRSRTSTSAA